MKCKQVKVFQQNKPALDFPSRFDANFRYEILSQNLCKLLTSIYILQV